MSGAWATLQALVARLLRHWPNKLMAILIAFLVWLYVTTNNATITQSSLLVTLIVEGVEENQVAVGLPTQVAVSVSGPSTRIDRLTTDMLRATLDLTEVTGAFEQPITVQAPQGIDVRSVEPTQVIGFLESVVSRPVPVQVALTGALPADSTVTATATPSSVVITGRSQVLDSVQRVVAAAPAIGGGNATPVALDSQGRAVADVTSGGTKCTTFEECKGLLEDGEDIDYDGASGPIELDDVGDPQAATYAIGQFEGGELTIVSSQEVDLADI